MAYDRLGVKPWTCFTGRRPESYRRIRIAIKIGSNLPALFVVIN